MKRDKTKQIIDVRDSIMSHLWSIERRLSWLRDKSGIPYSTLYSIFQKKERALKDDNLDKINKVLGTDFKL